MKYNLAHAQFVGQSGLVMSLIDKAHRFHLKTETYGGKDVKLCLLIQIFEYDPPSLYRINLKQWPEDMELTQESLIFHLVTYHHQQLFKLGIGYKLDSEAVELPDGFMVAE